MSLVVLVPVVLLALCLPLSTLHLLQVAQLECLAATSGCAAQHTITSLQDQLAQAQRQTASLQAQLQQSESYLQAGRAACQQELDISVAQAVSKTRDSCQQQLHALESRLEILQAQHDDRGWHAAEEKHLQQQASMNCTTY